SCSGWTRSSCGTPCSARQSCRTSSIVVELRANWARTSTLRPKFARRSGELCLLSLLRLSRHPRETFAPHAAYVHHAGRRVARHRVRCLRGGHQLDVDRCPATWDAGSSHLVD